MKTALAIVLAWFAYASFTTGVTRALWNPLAPLYRVAAALGGTP